MKPSIHVFVFSDVYEKQVLTALCETCTSYKELYSLYLDRNFCLTLRQSTTVQVMFHTLAEVINNLEENKKAETSTGNKTNAASTSKTP